MLELSANETPANKVEKVTQPIKKINMTKALWVLIGISYIARNIEHSRPSLFPQDIMPLDLCFYSRPPTKAAVIISFFIGLISFSGFRFPGYKKYFGISSGEFRRIQPISKPIICG